MKIFEIVELEFDAVTVKESVGVIMAWSKKDALSKAASKFNNVVINGTPGVYDAFEISPEDLIAMADAMEALLITTTNELRPV